MRLSGFTGSCGRLLVAGALGLASAAAMAERHWGMEAPRHGSATRGSSHAAMEKHHEHGLSLRHSFPVAPQRPQHVQFPRPSLARHHMTQLHGWHYDSGRWQHGQRMHRNHLYGGLGLLAGTALIYQASQPRTVYYNALPQTTTLVTSQIDYPVTPSYVSTPVLISPQQAQIGLPTHVMDIAPAGSNAVAGPGDSGLQWRYVCRHPAGAYPQVQECPSGWEKQPLSN